VFTVSISYLARQAALAAVISFAAASAYATETAQHPYEALTGTPLTLPEAMRLATTDQPLLSARQAVVDAEEQESVAASQLPDPKLSAGLQDLPIDRGEAFSVRDDDFTMFSVGLSQDLPRSGKRQLKGERKHLEADVDRLGLETDRRAIVRDTALDWLDVYEAEQSLRLTRQLADESALQVQSLESAYRAGRAAQADWLAAKVETALVGDKVEDGQHHVERMRAALSRWIGDAAQRPLAGDLAGLPEPEQIPRVLADVDRHPLVSGLQKQVDAAQKDVALARQAYQPDFSVEGYFGYRPAYADFVGVRVSMDLPFFTAQRQDRNLAAALHQSDAAQDRKEDALR
jgi:outer membrane protein, heavy metal efflux system